MADVKKRKYGPGEAKHQADKIHSRTSEPQFDFQPLLSTEGEAGDEERRGVDLLSVGQVGTKHQWLACVSLLN